MSKKIIVFVLAVALIGMFAFILSQKSEIEFTRAIGAVDAVSKAAQSKIHILIVPGHEPANGGTQFKSRYGMLYERNFTVELGDDLEQYLDANGNYRTDITRDASAWAPAFADYFQNDWNSIISWEHDAKSEYATGTKSDELDADSDGEIHNNAEQDVALRIYGIVKWADENGVDLMIHIHFNNYPGSPAKVAGKYSGLSMYIPPTIYGNGSSTLPIAQALFKRLSLYNPISNLPVESAGLMTDPSLIATGAYDTATMPSILIEYEYIYEPQFVNPATRSLAIKDLAYQTYLGLEDYFTKNTNVSAENDYNPSTLYAWNGLGDNKNSTSTDIYALQTALIMDGDYPPKGKTRNDCPHSGSFGACTLSALSAFQKKNNITGEQGVVGQKSFDILGAIYDGKNS